MNQKPTVGRIVHYTLSTGEVRPATVVRCWDDPTASYAPGVVNVQVLLDGRNDDGHGPPDISPHGKVTPEECERGMAWRTSVHPSKSGSPEPGCWHWPSRDAVAPRVPVVGECVVYLAYGTPGGEFKSVPRAAIITEVHNAASGEVSVCVLNPQGLFFNRVQHSAEGKPGCWSWPPRAS